MMDSGVMGSPRGGFSRRALARSAVGATSVATHARRRPAEQNAFVPLSGRESLFSAWPEKSNQKRGHPDGAPYSHPADFPPPARRAIGAPKEQRAPSAQKQRPEQSKALRAREPFASGAHDARLLFRGPWAAVRRGRQGRAAGEATDGLAFSRGQESARK